MNNVTVSIPQTAFQRAQALAKKRRQAVSEFLVEAIDLAEVALAEEDEEERQMLQEERAFQAMHDELMAHLAEHYVAVYKGQLVDHGKDEMHLLRRIDAHYSDKIVLIKQVKPLPELDLVVHTPRLLPIEP